MVTTLPPDLTLSCTADGNGYKHQRPHCNQLFEWCQDHNKPMQAHPFGDVAKWRSDNSAGSTIFANGPWFGGSPYLVRMQTVRAVGNTGTTPPSARSRIHPIPKPGLPSCALAQRARNHTKQCFPGEC